MTARLITMAAPASEQDIDISDLSDYEAGLAFLGMVNQIYPGVTMRQLGQLAYGNRIETMGRSFWERQLSHVSDALSPTKTFNKVKTAVGDIKDGIGDVLKDTFDATADAGGSIVRLFTDKKVVDGLNSSYESFTSSGGILGAVGGSSLSEGASNFVTFLTNLGNKAKANANAASTSMGLPDWAIPVGIGGVALILLLRRRRK